MTKYKAAAYARLSLAESDEYLESTSITNQKNFIKEYAEKEGIEIYDYYVDDGFSGGNFERPAFKRLIDDLERGTINCVITKDLSRLGRDFIETNNYIYKYFPEKGIRYISILDNLDTAKPNYIDDIVPFKTIINDMYLKDTSRKIKSVRHDLMKKGLFVGSSVPYGYKRSKEDSRKFEIDDYAADIIKRIFDMKIEGIKSNIIARTLTEEGILPPSVYNKKKIIKTYTTDIWKASTINHILSNEVYIGKLIQGKYERISLKSKKKQLLPKEKWIIIDNCHPAIVDKEKFYQINREIPKVLRDNTRTYKYDYLLKGLVTCYECGKNMIVRRIKTKKTTNTNTEYSIYCCGTYARYRKNVCSMHYYREDRLNEIVLKNVKLLLKKFSTKKQLKNTLKQEIVSNDLLKKHTNQLAKHNQKLIDLNKALSELYKDKVNKIISTEDFNIIKNGLQTEKQNIIKEIENLKLILKETQKNISDKRQDEIITEFLEIKNPTKVVLKELISKIYIDKNKNIIINFNFKSNRR